MYPPGCPSFQKISIKLFKVEPYGNKSKLRLIDSQFSTNREGFAFISRQLSKGAYQIQIKKYSFGFDVFDFTARIYSQKNIKLVDVEEQEIKKIKQKQDKKKEHVGSSRTITESSNPTSKENELKKHFTKAGD